MSFCPNKDIHSVYLDNEMPEVYKAEYESHIAECPKCRAELEKLRAVQSLLRKDSSQIITDSNFMEDSFSRLQVKMSYNKNVSKTKQYKFGYVSYVAAGIAAAAALAFIIPLNTHKNASVVASETITQIPPLTTANNVSFNSGKNSLVSSKIQETAISSKSKGTKEFTIAENVRNVDYLRPDFGDESISIRITVPGMGTSPVVTEITLPAEVISGRL